MDVITTFTRGSMSNLTVRQCKIADFVEAPNFRSILNAYEEECAIPEFRGANPKMDIYQALESMNKLLVIGAFSDDKLAGILIVVVTEFPHFSCLTASTESFFVDHDHRKCGTGRRMIDLAASLAKDMGAKGLFMSAVADSRLEKAAPLMGFRRTNTQFFKVLN